MKKINPSVKHRDYAALEKRYDLCKDAFYGDVTKHVPFLTEQTQEQWEAYVNRAAYYNVVDKTTYALVGALTRKPYEYEGTFPVNDYGTGGNFLQACYRDLLLGARCAILVDVTEEGTSKLTNYDADDIINWRGDGSNIGDFRVIEEEYYYPNPDNPFEELCAPMWRELYLDEEGYKVRLWTQKSKGEYSYEDIPPMLVNGRLLDYIPLWVSNTYDNTWDIYNPPLYTQSKVSIEYFKKATDIAHYEHFMALPTLTIVGDLATYTDQDGNEKMCPILLGSTTRALHLTQGSSASYTEISGTSHATLITSQDRLLEELYVAGSRLLTSKRGIESAEALQIRSGSESAVLSTLVNALEGALRPALVLCAEIEREAPTEIILNKDFTAAEMDPETIKARLALYTEGAITLDQLLSELYAGEVVKPEEEMI